MEKLIAALMVLFFGLALAIGFGALMALPVMWLWNYVVAGALGLAKLDFLHAWALFVLSNFLFKTTVQTKK